MAKLSLELEGVYTPIVAPMRANGDLDLDGFAKVIEFCLAGGVRGAAGGDRSGDPVGSTRPLTGNGSPHFQKIFPESFDCIHVVVYIIMYICTHIQNQDG